MQKNNNIYLLSSFLALFAILMLLLIINNAENEIAIDKSLFKVTDSKQINKVVLLKGTSKVTLNFNGIKWMLNDSLEADRQLVQVLFASLQQAEPKRQVALRQVDSVQQSFLSKGITVELFDEQTLVKRFSVVGNQKKNETYFQLQNDSQPYLVIIPGYRVYLAEIFELEFNDWREKRVFNFNWQNFKKLSTTFPSKKSEDFSISFQNGFFRVEENPKADTARINDYLDAVSLIKAESFVSEEKIKELDSLLSSQPLYVIQVVDIANRVYQLKVYEAPDHYPFIPARINENDIVFLDRKEIPRISKKLSDFKD